uniref:hypothetical protein n=1 Tax=Flavobacterium sp. TaxID=239 RepID=UPI0040484379
MLGFKKSFDKQINSTGFDVFRIFYSIVLLFEIGQMYYFRHLIFDRVPYLYEAEINFGIPIAIWFFSVLLVLFGAFTRFATILNYLLGLILIGSIKSFEYHVFYAYMGINFFLIFLPISNVFSIDRLLLKLKYSNTTFQYIPTKKTNQLYYFILPLVAIGFVYFDSVFYKLSSQMWLDGLGSWLPSSLPMITHTNNSWFLNNEWLVKIIGWFTIIFEAVFIFIFFRKKWRVPVFIVGFILHLGILIQFPIPWFALTVCAVYILIIPVGIWQKIFKVKNKSSLILYH